MAGEGGELGAHTGRPRQAHGAGRGQLVPGDDGRRGRREPWASAPWDEDRDWEFHTAPDDDPAEVLDLYREACERSRATVARLGDPEALAASQTRRGNRPSLRWVMLHMLEETARHNGHADLIRERVDGTTGE